MLYFSRLYINGYTMSIREGDRESAVSLPCIAGRAGFES